MQFYKRINPKNSFVEWVSIKSGRLYKLLKIDDKPDVETYQKHARIGYVNISINITAEEAKFIESIDTATFLPRQDSVKEEICSRVSDGDLITELCRQYIGRLPFPPYEVIKKWASEDKEFAGNLAESRKHAARIRFEQALRAADNVKDDPKALKTYVEILKRHAEIDDPDVFQVKPKDEERKDVAPIVHIYTGIPDRREEKEVKAVEVIEHE
jgi:hypothetical protein